VRGDRCSISEAGQFKANLPYQGAQADLFPIGPVERIVNHWCVSPSPFGRRALVATEYKF